MENNKDQQQGQRSAFSTGSTTQGGSNHGQGSSQLGGAAYEQGRESNEGANYENERGKLNSLNEDLSKKVENTPHSGGGAAGYDADREQQEVNKEREDMNNERDLDELNVEETPPQQEDEEEQNPLKETE
jgi:hypothetical protein